MFERLDSLPNDPDVTYVADFLELRAFINTEGGLNMDRNFSRSDFDTVCDNDQDDIYDNDQDDRYDNRGRISTKWSDSLRCIRARMNYFGDSYPFRVHDNKNDVIEFMDKPADLQKSYLSLLMLSSQRCIKRNKRHVLSREFEKMCLKLFPYCLPKGSTVKCNWAQPGPDDGCYAGTLPDKLKAIAKDIRARSDGISDDQYDSNNRGDDGIDLVAWHGMFDGRQGIPIAMAQCSCQVTDLRGKQSESSFSRHKSRLPVVQPWLNFYFLPMDFLLEKDKWRYESNIDDAIFVDRYRIIRLMKENDHPISLDLINHILDKN